MTPEELDRAIDFIVKTQADTAVLHQELAAHQKQYARMFKMISDLIEIELGRLDRNDVEHRKFEKEMQRLREETQKGQDELFREFREFFRELRRLIDRLLEKPDSRPN
jgi:hypothetical protein